MIVRAGGIDFVGELNSDQYSVVSAPANRPTLVLAGAGSGKTRTLTYRVAWLISELGFSPRDILLLTFTNKAARQMLERIQALTGFLPSEFWGGTFHSIGNRFLRIEGKNIGIEPNFEILDAEDSEGLLKNVVNSEYPKFFSDKNNPRAGLLYDVISYARNTMLSIPSAMACRFSWIETPSAQIVDIANAYEFEKRKRNYCDFDDLLTLWFKLLKDCPDVLQKYNARFANILVDEYQDTNKIQSEIIDLLAHRGQITAVGDDAQCIYSWRGAEIDNILEFRERHPSASIYKIERNYRSTPQILKFANAILSQMDCDVDYKKSLVAARAGMNKPVVIRAMDGISQGRRVAECISAIVDSGQYRYEDIAVLYRSHFQAMDLQLQLQYGKIPFAITSGLKFFEQAHVKDVIAQIRFAVNPYDKISFLRIVKFLPKVGEKTADKILAKLEELAEKRGKPPLSLLCDKELLSKVPAAARDTFKIVAADIMSLGEILKTAPNGAYKSSEPSEIGAGDAFQYDLFSNDALENLHSGTESKESGLANGPKELVKAACTGWYRSAMKSSYEDWEERVEDLDSLFEYAGRFDNIGEFLDNIALEMSETGSKPSESGDGISRVRLMTVHQAKGLEFPVVFVIGAAEGLFPSKRSIDDGDVEEERRLFYVASTRAMNHLIISYPRVAVNNGVYEMREPSRFLQDIDPSLYNSDIDLGY